MEVAAPGVPTNGLAAATAPAVAVADPYAVVRYLTDVLQVTLGASKRDLETTGSLLSKAKYSETVQKCTRFASESQVALYVQQDIFSAEEPNGAESDEGRLLHLAYEKVLSV
jgi:dynein heavy chain 1